MSWILVVKFLGLVVGVIGSLSNVWKDSDDGRNKRRATLLTVLGFGVALTAELVDASEKQKAAIESTKRNNELLAEVERTLRPLFPLSVDVGFRAPLADNATHALRSALERKYQREHDRDRRTSITWLHPEEPEFPSAKNDPEAFEIVAAALSSRLRLFSNQRTKAGALDRPDIEFFPDPLYRDDRFKHVALISGQEVLRIRLAERDYLFTPDLGLYMSDRDVKVDFVDSRSTTDLVSVDDLLGADRDPADRTFSGRALRRHTETQRSHQLRGCDARSARVAPLSYRPSVIYSRRR